MKRRLVGTLCGAFCAAACISVASALLLTQGTVIFDLTTRAGYQFAAINTTRDQCGAGASCVDQENANIQGDEVTTGAVGDSEAMPEGDDISPEELILTDLAATCGLEPDTLTQTSQSYSDRLGEVVAVYSVAAQPTGSANFANQILHLTGSQEVLCAEGHYYYIPTGQRSGRIGLVP